MSDLRMLSWNDLLAASSPELPTMKPLNRKTTGNGPSMAPSRSLPPLGSVTAQHTGRHCQMAAQSFNMAVGHRLSTVPVTCEHQVPAGAGAGASTGFLECAIYSQGEVLSCKCIGPIGCKVCVGIFLMDRCHAGCHAGMSCAKQGQEDQPNCNAQDGPLCCKQHAGSCMQANAETSSNIDLD